MKNTTSSCSKEPAGYSFRWKGCTIRSITSPRLGSINHTLLSLEACRNRNIEVAKVVYNLYPPTDAPITDGTRDYLKTYLREFHPQARWLEVNDRYEVSEGSL